MTFALVLYAAFVLALTVAEYRGDSRAQYLLKPACALGFILIAIMSGALETRYGQIILAGLIACAAGDVLLLKRGAPRIFTLGIAAFAIGHILFAHAFYIVSLASGPPDFSGLISAVSIGVTLAAILGFTAFQICKKAEPKMRAPIIIYTLIIWTMLVFAVFTQIPILILGAMLFAVSDMFVARDRFVAQKPWHAIVITPLYFGAQALFALSVANAL